MVSLPLWFRFVRGQEGLQFVEKATWIPSIGVSYHFGVDGISTLLILLTHPATLDEALFEVVSAFATCGLSLGLTGQLNPFGQIVIMIVMFWGRLGALTIVAALAHQRPAPLVAYPKEDILIG